MNELDKTEYAKLESQVAEVERIIEAGAGAGASNLLGEFLRNAKARMNEIRPEGSLSERQRKDDGRIDQLAVAAMVERETRLSAAEKEQYGGFLKLDYFTKANFGELEEFYSGAWDRLSEEGKEQMSHRVWEGVRQGEYSFADLPENVRKKEADRLYEQIADASRVHGALANIPEQDRADFIRAHESGDSKAEAEILSRESFSMNVSTISSKEGSLRDPSVSSKKEADVQKDSSDRRQESNGQAEESAFSGFTLAESSEVTRPDLPTQPGASGIQRS